MPLDYMTVPVKNHMSTMVHAEKHYRMVCILQPNFFNDFSSHPCLDRRGIRIPTIRLKAMSKPAIFILVRL